MLKYNNTHIFTGYLKQLLASFNLPTCRVYTKEYAKYLEKHGVEDPRVIESFDNLKYAYIEEDMKSSLKTKTATRVNYLKGDTIYNYMWNGKLDNECSYSWHKANQNFYDSSKSVKGLTRNLSSFGNIYDTATHEYLGNYLRFIRDYYSIDLMSLYNCFNNSICNNLMQNFSKTTPAIHTAVFNSQDSRYNIYAIPVKLFAEYTIAIDCQQSVEMFCGFYQTALDSSSDAAKDLMNRTYKKVTRPRFSQPFLYDLLSVEKWNAEKEREILNNKYPRFFSGSFAMRQDIARREQDLKLFIKIPVSCKSSIVILEGDFRHFNDHSYSQVLYKQDGSQFNILEDDAKDLNKIAWEYKQNHTVLNFGVSNELLNKSHFKPINKLQLLAFNTGESYPFSDRLIEYLCSSVITPIDDIHDNIKRAQYVMSQNKHYFQIPGLWENKMQKIIYDYLLASGEIEVENDKIVDKRKGYHKRLGHVSKSRLYDILGYIDKDAEKWYASWYKDEATNKACVHDTIQNVNIYGKLYEF